MIPRDRKQLLLNPFQSWHCFMLSLGLLPGLVYLPIWLWSIARRMYMGSSSVVLNLCFIALGFYLIFEQRNKLKTFKADAEDRFVGYALVIGTVTMHSFLFSAPSLQAITSATSLIGVSLSVFGNRFVRKYTLAISMIVLGLLPKYLELGYSIGKIILPHDVLEKLMALVSGSILQLIGQPAIIHGKIIQVGNGAVNIADGCSGYSMAVILAGVGFIVGIFYKLKPMKTFWLMLTGVVIALTINVPRILLLTYSVIYWGDASFKFWHDGWGSQIVAGIMLTVFYYVSMAICKKTSVTA